MIEGFMWPDVVIVLVVFLSALKGYMRGFVAEVAGVFAIFFALLAPWWYRGTVDAQVASTLHVALGVAHLIGMILAGIAVYVAVMAGAWLLDRFAKLPVISLVNSLAGIFAGVVKGAVFLWFALFIALFFPLTTGIRADLHRSTLVHYLTASNGLIDATIATVTPQPMRSAIAPYLTRHRI